jgi:hypothetical protein
MSVKKIAFRTDASSQIGIGAFYAPDSTSKVPVCESIKLDVLHDTVARILLHAS